MSARSWPGCARRTPSWRWSVVFSRPDAAGIWERARDRLGRVRVEVDTDPGQGPGLAWELLRDPGRDAPVALAARAFVRTHLQAAGHPDLPELSGDRLRVLLVIARPGGGDDVPFRSVASRLVRGGAERMAGLDLMCCARPPSPGCWIAAAVSRGAFRRPRHLLGLVRFGLTPCGNGQDTATGADRRPSSRRDPRRDPARHARTPAAKRKQQP